MKCTQACQIIPVYTCTQRHVQQYVMQNAVCTDLDNSSPCVRIGRSSGAIRAHMSLNHILHNKRLLQDCTIENFTLYCQLCLESAGVRLCPYEASIN